MRPGRGECHYGNRIFLSANGADRTDNTGNPVTYEIPLLPEILKGLHCLEKMTDGAQIRNNVEPDTVLLEFSKQRIQQDQISDAVRCKNK